MLRFDEKSFFKTLLGFVPFSVYTPTNAFHADSSGVNFSHKILNLNTINKIHLKCQVIDGSVGNGLRQPILYSFTLDKLNGYKVWSEVEIQLSKK